MAQVKNRNIKWTQLAVLKSNRAILQRISKHKNIPMQDVLGMALRDLADKWDVPLDEPYIEELSPDEIGIVP